MLVPLASLTFIFFFFNDTATTEIYTLSLHDALPISPRRRACSTSCAPSSCRTVTPRHCRKRRDRKSTRLNSSHGYISYAVFCLKKKKKKRDSKNVSTNNSAVSTYRRTINHEHTS